MLGWLVGRSDDLSARRLTMKPGLWPIGTSGVQYRVVVCRGLLFGGWLVDRVKSCVGRLFHFCVQKSQTAATNSIFALSQSARDSLREKKKKIGDLEVSEDRVLA